MLNYVSSSCYGIGYVKVVELCCCCCCYVWVWVIMWKM